MKKEVNFRHWEISMLFTVLNIRVLLVHVFNITEIIILRKSKYACAK